MSLDHPEFAKVREKQALMSNMCLVIATLIATMRMGVTGSVDALEIRMTPKKKKHQKSQRDPHSSA